MRIFNNIIIFIAFFNLICSCNSRLSYREEIAESIGNGTDSTYERIFVNKQGWSDYYTNKAKNRIPYKTKTSFKGIKIETIFVYNYDDDHRRILNNIFSIFEVDSITNGYGHYFDFENGEYNWFYDSEKGLSGYKCNIDSLGNIIKEIGSIQVDAFRDLRYKTSDVIFTTIFHNLDSVIISSPKTKSKKYEIKPYGWQPMTSYVLLDYSTDSIFYIETYATRRKEKVRQIYTDTFYVK